MRKSEIVGRKVKMIPNCLFYFPECTNNNQGVVHRVTKLAYGRVWVVVADPEGCLMPCAPAELRYLNNREVVVRE